MFDDTDSGSELFLRDVKAAIEASRVGGRSYDLIITVSVRPGEEPGYDTRLIRKRKRRKKEIDSRQMDLLTA